MRDAAGVTKTLRLGAMVNRAVDAVLPSFPHVIPVAVWDGGLHTSAQHCVRCRSVFKYTTDVAGVKSLSEPRIGGIEGLGGFLLVVVGGLGGGVGDGCLGGRATTRDRPYVVVGTNNVIPAKAGIQRGGRQRCGVAPPLSFGHFPRAAGETRPGTAPGHTPAFLCRSLGLRVPFRGAKGDSAPTVVGRG